MAKWGPKQEPLDAVDRAISGLIREAAALATKREQQRTHQILDALEGVLVDDVCRRIDDVCRRIDAARKAIGD